MTSGATPGPTQEELEVFVWPGGGGAGGGEGPARETSFTSTADFLIS